MKRKILFLIVSCLLNIYARGESTPTLDGEWEYSHYMSTNVLELKGGKIYNNYSHKTGNIELKIYLTDKKFDGSIITGHLFYTKTYSPLEEDHYYYDIDTSGECKRIPNGTYFVTLVLCENNSIVDYLNFNGTITINNPPPPKPTIPSYTTPSYKTPSYTPSYTPPPPSEPRLKLVKKQCTTCHGLGKNTTQENATSRYYADDPCDTCVKFYALTGRSYFLPPYYIHYHKLCPSCNGKGYYEWYE